MVKEREQLAEATLNHALEIICLLTVEDFIVVKRPPDGNRCTFSIRAAEITSTTCDSHSGCPELLFTLQGIEDKTQKMVAELANKIACLMSREIPAECEDVAVCFSEDKCDHLKVHGERHKNNQDACTIEQPTAPVQPNPEKSYPVNYCIKEEPNEKPLHATEQPTAPVQQSTEKSYPMKCCLKEEPNEKPLHATVSEQPTAPVQQRAEKSYPMKFSIKKERNEEPHNTTVKKERNEEPHNATVKKERNEEAHNATDGTSALPLALSSALPSALPLALSSALPSALPSAQLIPGRLETRPLLPTVNVYIPFVGSQPASGLILISSCDLKPAPSGGSSENTMTTVGAEQPTAPVQQSTEKSYPMKCCLKEEPNEKPLHATEQPTAPVQQSTEKSYPMKCCIKKEPDEEPHNATGGTSALPSLEFIPETPERKPLPTVNVHIPVLEGQTTCDIKPEPDGGSSEDTMDSIDIESPQPPSSPDRENDYTFLCNIKEEPEESQDLSISASGNTISPADKDEDYLPPKANCKKAKTRKSGSAKPSPPCEVCGKIFSSKSTLDTHRQIHTGQRPFSCNECGQRFSSRNHLTTHERSHSGERPFACDQCDRKFYKQQHLVLHQVVHTGEKPFSCPVCGKGFTRQSSVVKHSGMHAEQKPHVCDVCGKSYCQYANLVVHQRLHSGEKPFVCQYCERAFICKDTMLRHQRSHTGEKPFSCPNCNKCFTDKSTLNKHKLTHL